MEKSTRVFVAIWRASQEVIRQRDDYADPTAPPATPAAVAAAAAESSVALARRTIGVIFAIGLRTHRTAITAAAAAAKFRAFH